MFKYKGHDFEFCRMCLCFTAFCPTCGLNACSGGGNSCCRGRDLADEKFNKKLIVKVVTYIIGSCFLFIDWIKDVFSKPR